MFSVDLKIAKVRKKDSTKIANGHSRFGWMVKTTCFPLLFSNFKNGLFGFTNKSWKGSRLNLEMAERTGCGGGPVDKLSREEMGAGWAKFG